MSNQDWNQQITREHKYQVWITEWAVDSADDSPQSKQKLVGQYDVLLEAVQCVQANESYNPIMTRIVTWQTTVTDTTNVFDTEEAV